MSRKERSRLRTWLTSKLTKCTECQIASQYPALLVAFCGPSVAGTSTLPTLTTALTSKTSSNFKNIKETTDQNATAHCSVPIQATRRAHLLDDAVPS